MAVIRAVAAAWAPVARFSIIRVLSPSNVPPSSITGRSVATAATAVAKLEGEEEDYPETEEVYVSIAVAVGAVCVEPGATALCLVLAKPSVVVAAAAARFFRAEIVTPF